MLETHLTSPVTRPRVRTGAAAEHIDAFALSGFEACKLVVSKEQRVRYSRGPNQQSITAASLFIRFLRRRGELPQPVAEPSATEPWPILVEFRSWMRAHRGLTETTLDVYQGILVGLLDAVGDDARAYSPGALRPSSLIERALTGSSVPRAWSSPSARSAAFSVPLGGARRAGNMRFLVSPHGGSHQFPGSSLQKMSSG